MTKTPLTTSQIASIVPGLEDNLSEEELMLALCCGVMQMLHIVGMLKIDKPFLNYNGSVIVDRLMVRMKKVPTADVLLKALEDPRNHIPPPANSDWKTISMLVHRVLSNGFLTSMEEFHHFQRQRRNQQDNTRET